MAGTVLTSYINKPVTDDLDGYWMGYYRTGDSKEKVIIKLGSDERLDLYAGGINDQSQLQGTYRVYGDSVAFHYTSPEGEDVLMEGHFNHRKTYMDGLCKTNNKPTGSFYLERQDLEERFIEP